MKYFSDRLHFNFSSPLPPIECWNRLATKSERRYRADRHRLLVELDQPNDNTYTFCLQQDVGRNLNVEVYGSMQSYDGTTTVVSGKARLSRSTLWLLILLIFVDVLFTFVVRFWLITLPGALIFIYQLLGTIQARRELIRMITEALEGKST
jgi:hypothetical protein